MRALGPHDVHVWLTFHDAIGAELDATAALLSESELDQAQRFHMADDRQRHLVARALVRTVLSRYADVAPADWRFAANAHGRPELADGATGLRFNLSHARGLVALAVSRGRDIGVDVECVTGRPVTPRLGQRFFSAEEARALARVPEEQRQERLLAYWTLKEAYIKARGYGLNFPLKRFSVDLGTPGTICLEIDPALDDDPARWCLAQYRPTPGHLLALCAERLDGDVPQVSMHEMVPTCEPKPFSCPPQRVQTGCNSSRSK